jgi:hypothetical protein
MLTGARDVGVEESIDNPVHLAGMRAFDHDDIAGVNFRLQNICERIRRRGVNAPAVGRQVGKHMRHFRPATENQIDIDRAHKTGNVDMQVL